MSPIDSGRGCFIALACELAMVVAASAAPDISGTYWATRYSPKIAVQGGGEPPLNDAGKAAYAANQAGLKDGTVVTRRGASACRTGCRGCSPRPIRSRFFRCRPTR